MSEFQTVKRRGHSQSANSKYPEQHQQLVEMGFDASSVSRALDASNGDMEAATAVLIGEDRSNKSDADEKNSKEKKSSAPSLAAATAASASTNATAADGKAKAGARQPTGLASVSGPVVKEIKDSHQRMMATYKVQKCKETGAHDRKMCMHYHSLSDRRRNPFEILYSCYECPNTVDGGECPDGDSCMHSHTMLERMFHPELYKISVCQRQLTGNKCDRAMLCAFAHNDADLRISPSHLTTKYAMQEEAKAALVPVNQSAMLDHIRNNLIKLIKEHGSEGVIAADLPKHYQGKFHESLDIIDETGKKYKLKDLVGPHNNIHVVMSSQPKFVYGDPTAATDNSEATAAASSAPAVKDSATSPLSVKDRVVELIKSAGADGILATDMPKRYQDRYGEKIDKDWSVGLNTVAGMVLTQTKQYTKYTFNNAISSAGIKDAATPTTAGSVSKDGKSPAVAGNSTNAAKVAVGAVTAAPAATTATASKWGSSAGKSFASILASSSNSTGPSISAPTSQSESNAESVTSSASSITPPPSASVEPASTPVETKTSSTPVAVVAPSSKTIAPKASEKPATSKSTSSKPESKPEEPEKETVVAPSTTTTTESVAATSSLPMPSSPASAAAPVGLSLKSSPATSRASSDLNASLPKPLFGGLDSQLSIGGLSNDQFSLSGLGGNGSSSLLDLTGTSLTGILPSSFDLPLVENIDLNTNSVLPPGLSKTIGKSSAGSSSSAPSLTSILGGGLTGIPLSSSSIDTPERNASNGTSASATVNTSNMTPSERIAYLERELAAKSQESESHVLEIASLRSRVSDLENAQLSQDERLRNSILEKDIELLAKHQEVAKFEEELRKMKEEKLVDLDQYFIYFSKIEEVMNSMKCKEEAFSDKVKPEDVQELFQFKKLIRNYVANVKVQLKNKFDVAMAQSHLLRTNSSGPGAVKDSVEAVALGIGLTSGPPPGGLTSATSGAAALTTTSTPSSTSVFGVLAGGSSAAPSTGTTSSALSGSSRFAGSFDSHSVPFSHHHGLGSVVDAFASSSVLFPSSTDLSGTSAGTSSSVLPNTKQCGLPGCFKEGLYTCAGCRKISYCGEAHQRSHWAQHSQSCYQR